MDKIPKAKQAYKSHCCKTSKSGIESKSGKPSVGSKLRRRRRRKRTKVDLLDHGGPGFLSAKASEQEDGGHGEAIGPPLDLREAERPRPGLAVDLAVAQIWATARSTGGHGEAE
ncbi:hypothetical protein NL676_016204 [Syzygium grande]|nr:hypothetical protein NL676_016204 [Syzygium grande]